MLFYSLLVRVFLLYLLISNLNYTVDSNRVIKLGKKHTRNVAYFLTLLIYIIYHISKTLLLCGDLETNPGPAAIGYMDLQHQVSCSPSLLKFFHVNAQSARKQRTHLIKLIQDLTPNTIFGITETWLTPEDDEKLWHLDPLYSSFRNDRKSNAKGGGVLLAVPKILSPKVRPDLCTHFEQTSFESMWVEYSSTGSGTKAVVAVLYNPSKSLMDNFLNTLNRSIDIVAADGKSLTIMGDLNINYLKESERTKLSTVLNPYGLKVCNTFLPTRITENGSSVIDYIVTDTSFTDSFVCDTIVKSDHLAQLVLSQY